MGVSDGSDVKVPEGIPAPIVSGGKSPVEVAKAPVLAAPPLAGRDTAEPTNVAVPNPGKIVCVPIIR